MKKRKEDSVLVLLPGGWKVDLFHTDLDALGITVEKWQSSDPVINEDAKSIDIFVHFDLSILTDATRASVVTAQTSKVECPSCLRYMEANPGNSASIGSHWVSGNCEQCHGSGYINAPAASPSFEGLLVLLLEKMEDPEWRRDFEKDSPGDLAYLESLMAAIRGFFTEQGTTNEQDVLLARAGFPRTVVTGCPTSDSMRREAANLTHLKLNEQIGRAHV